LAYIFYFAVAQNKTLGEGGFIPEGSLTIEALEHNFIAGKDPQESLRVNHREAAPAEAGSV
jgi:hypothetical protein